MNLWSRFLNNNKRPIYKWTHYFPIYERHLAKYRNQSITLFEIGCALGGSLQMWKEFLGPFVQIVGIDIIPECKTLEEEQIAIRIGDQSDPRFLASVVKEFGAPDIVIDDGSHMMKDIDTSFNFLYPLVPINGQYIVEDLHTCYWEEYGGGHEKPGTFIETAKKLIDSLNADHSRGAVEQTSFTRETMSMHFYDSVLVFEKGRHIKKYAPEIED